MTWHPVAEVGEIVPGKPKIIPVNGKEVGIFFEGGRYFAVLNFCPHFGAPVCEGRVFGAVTATSPGEQTYDPDRLVLRCPWHRWEFDLETGQALTPIRQRLKTYSVKIGQDAIDNDSDAITTYDVRSDGTTIWVLL